MATIAATEGFSWGSTYSYLNQNIDVTVGRRDEVSPAEALIVGGVTASIPFALRGTGAGVTKFKNSVADSRAARIEGEADYKGSVFDIGLEKYDEIIDGVLPNYRRLSGFVNKPTSRFIAKIKEDENLAKLIKLLRYDASKQLFGKDATEPVERTGRAFYEYLNNAVGKRADELDKILFPLYEKTKRQVPKFGSRDAFISLSSRRAERESFFNTQGIPDNLNNALVYVMRSGMKKAGNIVVDGKKVSLKQAFSLTDEQYKQVFPTVTKLNKFFSSIRDEAVAEGIKLGKIENYLPRSWSYAALKQELKNLDRGIEGKLVKEIKSKEGLETNQVKKLLEEMLDPNQRRLNPFNDVPTSVLKKAGQSPAFVKARELRNIDDSILSDYLDNSLENLTRDYTTQSAAYIQRTKHLGKDIAAFRKKHLDNITNLTASEKTGLENIYRTMTGQHEPVGPESIRKVGRAIGNFSVVVNQLSLLPLATITSFSEIGVPMLRGAGSKREGISTIFETANEYRKFWWNDVVSKDIADARPEVMKELNRFNRAMRSGAEDRSLAMYGEAFGPRAMKAQNKFFKINLLHDWTKFVQLVSFKVGKSKIYDNLDILANTKNLSSKRKTRLENQLKELDVDIAAGLKWVKSGAKPSGKFYDENLLPSAARYVDEVIMNPTAAANQKPIWHSMPSTRWAFGLMGFPTAFSNTVIKNAVREVSLDVRNRQLEAVPSVMAGLTAMTGIAMFGNTLRSGGDNLERLANGETELSQEVVDGLIRTGLFSMTGENLYRTVKGTEYDNFARSMAQRFTGPAIDDIFRFFDDYVGPLAWAVDEFPGITAIRSTNRELYDALKKGAREYDKEFGWVATGPRDKVEGSSLSTPTKPLSTRNREGFAEGLEVNVPYTKDEPEERVNPFTGEPYTAIYKRRTAFGAGGIASILRGIWKAPTQNFTSAATSISQTPAGFKKIKALDGWQAGTKNLDIGGGASFKGAHKHTDALKEEGVENLVFDPFNRAPEENALAVERLGFGKADTATAHNVLNVIPDETSQLQVIKQMENALKPGGRGYITVYKGAGTGKGKQSRSDSFQQNKKTDEYLPLIRKVFPNAERKGDLIYFNKVNKNNISSIDKERIKKNAKKFKGSMLSKMSQGVDDSLSAREKFISEDIYKPFSIGSRFITSQFGDKKIYEVVDFSVRRVADRKSNARVPGLLIRTVKDDLLNRDPKDISFMYLYKDPTSKNPTQGIFDFVNKDKDYVKFLTGPKDIK